MAIQEPSLKRTVKLEKTESKSNSGDFNLKGLLSYIWRKKLWVLLSLAVCLGYAYYDYKQHPHIYESEAKVMFLFGDQQSSAGSTIASLTEQGAMANVNLNNELAVIKSPSLMEDVVKILGLETSYTTPRMGYNENLYGYSPVEVRMYDIAPEFSASFKLRRIDEKRVLAYDFRLNGSAVKSPGLRIPVNCVVETPVGMVAVIPTGNYANFPEEITVSKRSLESVATSLAAKVTTTPDADGNTVVTLGFKDTNQQLATDIIAQLVESYNALWTEENQRSANQTSEFIRERLVSLESELSGIDRNIASKKKVTGGQIDGDVFMPKAEEKIDQAYEMNTNLTILENNRARIQDEMKGGHAINAVSGNAAVDGLISQYNETLAKAIKASEGAGENNSVVKEYNSQLERLRSGISTGLNSMLADAKLQTSRVQSLGNAYRGRGMVIPDVQADMLPVERQQKVKESLYLYLLQKREENELNKMIASYNTRIIQPAHSKGVVGPFIVQSMATGLIAGLAIPLAVLFLLFRFDTRVKSRADLKGITAPFLGEMPMNDRKKKRRNPLKALKGSDRGFDDANLDIVVKERSRSYINEAFRIVRTNLDFMTSDAGGSQVIIMTSYEPGSGKTFITLNLAVSLALKRKRVLVIDADLRRASLSKYEGNTVQGLSSVLSGKVSDPFSLIVKDNKRGLVDILNVGAIPPNPVELLLSEKFGNMIATFKEHYDYILLDCPPYDLVADTAIIAGEADTSIFVIRAGLFRKSAIADVEELYKSGKLPRMTVLLNGIDPKKTYYNHRYGYKTDHGYYIKEEDEDAATLAAINKSSEA